MVTREGITTGTRVYGDGNHIHEYLVISTTSLGGKSDKLLEERCSVCGQLRKHIMVTQKFKMVSKNE